MFFDSDDNGKEDYDIRGDEYQKLIDICCKYSKTFSVVITNPFNPIVEKLRPFQIVAPGNIATVPLSDILQNPLWIQIVSEICQ